MRYRKLRVAWSVFWGIACVLLTVLWANSNISVDSFSLPVTQACYFNVALVPNELYIGLGKSRLESGTWYDQTPTDEWVQEYLRYNGVPWSATPYFFSDPEYVVFPYWFAVLLSATFSIAAMMLELRWHFTTRMLLLGTTLVAATLWLVLYIARN